MPIAELAFVQSEGIIVKARSLTLYKVGFGLILMCVSSDVSTPGVRNKNGKILTRSSRLEEEDVMNADQLVVPTSDLGTG